MTEQGAGSRPDIDAVLERIALLAADLARDIGSDRRTVLALESVNDRLSQLRVPVVMVGEVSRGKSTLINALLGKKLLPCDFRATTSTWTQICHGPAFTAMAYVEEADEDLVTRVEIRAEQDLGIYLSAAPDSARALVARHGKNARVLSVDIELPAAVLESGLELLDTPGVGGLRAAHRTAALTALAHADAVIFVTTPGEPLSKSELVFLAEATERVAECALVQTHDDQSPDGEAALRENRITLADPATWEKVLGDSGRAQRLAARFASVRGASVSASNALTAAGLADGETRRALLEDSKIAFLLEILDRDIVANGHKLHRQNIRTLIAHICQDARARAQERILIYEGDEAGEALIDALDARIARWVEDSGDYWRSQIEADCGKLADKLAARARERARELDHTYRGEFKSMTRPQLETAIELLADAPGALLLELVDTIDRTMDDATRRIRSLLEAEGLAGTTGQADRSTAILKRLSPRAGRAANTSDIEDLRSVIVGGMSGVGIASALQGLGLIAVGAAAPIFWPFLIGAGVFVGINRLRRSHDRSVESATLVLDRAIEEIHTTAYSRACEILTAVKADVEQNIGDALRELQEQVRQDRQRLAEASGMTPGRRAKRIVEMKAIIERADDLAAELAALPDA